MLNNFKYTKEDVEKVIHESPDMITALEAVGAMYGIPSSHMMAQPGLKTIRVENDMILAPADAKPNTKAIVCAIGAVLDHISQRINDKLDNFQSKNIAQGKVDDKVSATANPNKGNVISHHTLSDGSEVIVYDSGLVDMPHTPEARMKVAELKAKGEIPNTQVFNDGKEYQRPSFFTPEENNIALSPDEDRRMKSNDPTPINMSEITGESDLHLEMYAHFNGTDHLGYDLLQEQGFDYVRITEAFITEAAKANKILTKDIKHMKFDNTEITKAIKCFNEARAEQSNAGKGEFDIKKFIEHPKYIEAVNHLNNQFNCNLSIHWHNDKENVDLTELYTLVDPSVIAQNMTISKTKGFQLNGLGIDIRVTNNAIDEEMSKDANVKLFGQFVCAGLCHEIFHNIANAIRVNNAMFAFTLESALAKAAGTEDPKQKRAIFERYAKTLTKTDVGIVSMIERKRLADMLFKISELSKNQNTLNDLRNGLNANKDVESEVNQLIKRYEGDYNNYKEFHDKMMKRGKKYESRNNNALFTIGIILCCTIVGAPIGIPMIVSIGDNKLGYDYARQYKNYLEIPDKEEYYCDLFSGMYNLPLSFTIGDKKRNFTANMISSEQLQKLTTIEKKLMDLIQCNYPTIQERNYAAYTIAKNILASNEKISKEYKEYCQWVVDNYSNMEKTDIGTDYRKQSFNPKEAEDLDKHVQNLVDNNNIKLTEYSTK